MARFGDTNPFGDVDDSNPFANGSPRPAALVSPSVPVAPSISPTFLPAARPVSPVTPMQPAPAPSNYPGASNDFASPLNFYEDPSHKAPVYGAMSPAAASVPPYMDQARMSTDEMRRRQEELDRKAAELDKREAQLRSSPADVRQNNFPPLPKFCCVGPCFYQDFDVDIPLGFKSTVKSVFYIWMIYSILLLINVVAAIAYMSIIGTEAAMTFGLSILYVVLFPALAFVCWYRPVYKAFRSDSSLSFFVFFFNSCAQIGVSIVQCLGLDVCGTCGIINGLKMISKSGLTNISVGGFMLVLGVLFACLAAALFFIACRVHRIYRSTGASLAKAQQEFATRAVQNEHVQNAAIGIARSSVQEAGRTGRF